MKRFLVVMFSLVAGCVGVMAELWTPAEISTIGWWDASDDSTIATFSSSGTNYYTQLDDLSGNGNHAVQNNVTNMPIYGTKTINGVQAAEVVDPGVTLGIRHMPFTSIITNKGEIAVFGLFETDASKASCFIGSTGNIKVGPWNASSIGYRFSENASPPTVGVGQTIVQTPTMLCFYRDNTNGVYITANGSVPIFWETTSNSNSPNWHAFNYGKFGNQALDGALGEVIVVAGLTETNRYMIEGYAAWKWGVEAKLPVAHPYYGGPPQIPPPAGTVFLFE